MYIKKSIEPSLCTDLMQEEFKESLWCTVRTEIGDILGVQPVVMFYSVLINFYRLSLLTAAYLSIVYDFHNK